MSCTHPLDPLFQTEQGIVFRCRCCGWFNVVFGPVILAQDRRGFNELRTLIDRLRPEVDPARHAGARCYHLHTANRQIGLAFTQEEMDELRELLAGAAAMDELDALLQGTLGTNRPASS
ncbi:MAG: hypothetical protein D6685_09435 [Bacteroidetes bacterium]|nr:MAG: hypothetical protein D6685_09435 [Bacteroidota bacterium]